MGSRIVLVLAGAFMATAAAADAGPDREVASGDPAAPKLETKDLGGGRLQLGQIVIEQAAGRFELPATVLRDEPPFEFLAVAKGGYKSYESLLELDASAREFSLACILIGLDPERGKPPTHHFDPEPAEGDPVDLRVFWKDDGTLKEVEVSDLLRLGEEAIPGGEWVYTGSTHIPDGGYLAEIDGSVVGFVHDPASIIEHRSGFGLGNFGAVEANRALLPPVGSVVTLRVERRAAAAPDARAEETDGAATAPEAPAP